MRTSNTTSKMTYATALRSAIECEALTTEVREKLTALLEQQEKKNSSTTRKPTATQVENEKIKASILEEMETDCLYTVTEMLKELPCVKGLTNQRVSALLRQLMALGKVEKSIGKGGKSYFCKK